MLAGSLRRSPFSSGASAKTSPRRVFASLTFRPQGKRADGVDKKQNDLPNGGSFFGAAGTFTRNFGEIPTVPDGSKTRVAVIARSPFARKRKRWAGWMRKRNVTSPTGGHFFGVAGSLGKQPFGFFPLLAHVFVNGGTEPFAFDEIFCKRIDDLQGNLKLGGGFFVVAPLF